MFGAKGRRRLTYIENLETSQSPRARAMAKASQRTETAVSRVRKDATTNDASCDSFQVTPKALGSSWRASESGPLDQQHMRNEMKIIPEESIHRLNSQNDSSRL